MLLSCIIIVNLSCWLLIIDFLASTVTPKSSLYLWLVSVKTMQKILVFDFVRF